MTRTTLRQRLAAHLDRVTADADAQAAAYGLSVTATSRHGRTYRDQRFGTLREARAAGCFCVPMCPAVCRLAAVSERQKARAA
jgi:hypothetical protein